MADTKITDLTALTGAASASTDVAVVVDVSDTTMAASGTNKKMTLAELGAAVKTHGSLQAQDGDLDAIAALSPTNDDIIQRKAGAWTNRTIAQLKTDLAILEPTQQVFSSGSGTYNRPAGCTAIVVEMVGGGGGGGGTPGHASQSAAASGGGSGAYCKKFIASPSSSYSYAVGSGGTGATGNANGNDGNDTTFDTLTAPGGDGGGRTGNGTSVIVSSAAGAGGAVATGGDVNAAGAGAGMLARINSTLSTGSDGAASYFGGGGRGGKAESATVNGSDATAPGAGGGGGAHSSSATAADGGDGANGIIVVTEFYF